MRNSCNLQKRFQLLDTGLKNGKPLESEPASPILQILWRIGNPPRKGIPGPFRSLPVAHSSSNNVITITFIELQEIFVKHAGCLDDILQ
jgi:hypothetical protein